jgi:hypothetical protein
VLVGNAFEQALQPPVVGGRHEQFDLRDPKHARLHVRIDPELIDGIVHPDVKRPLGVVCIHFVVPLPFHEVLPVTPLPENLEDDRGRGLFRGPFNRVRDPNGLDPLRFGQRKYHVGVIAVSFTDTVYPGYVVQGGRYHGQGDLSTGRVLTQVPERANILPMEIEN